MAEITIRATMKYTIILLRRARLDCFAAMKNPPSSSDIIYRYSNANLLMRQVNNITFLETFFIILPILHTKTANLRLSTVKNLKNIVAYWIGGYKYECE